MTDKVLVAAPIIANKDYCLPQFAKTLMSLTYENYDVYLSDNSPDKNHARNVMRKYGFECDHVYPEINHPMAGICASQNQILTRAIFGNYQYVCFIEEDVIPPANCIEILIAQKQLVCSLPYMIGIEKTSTLSLMDLEEFEYAPQNRLIPFKESLEKFNGTAIDTKGSGLGCTLIHSKVLDMVKSFGIIERKKHIPSDTFFYMDLQRLGITPQLVTDSGFCKHNNTQWII